MTSQSTNQGNGLNFAVKCMRNCEHDPMQFKFSSRKSSSGREIRTGPTPLRAMTLCGSQRAAEEKYSGEGGYKMKSWALLSAVGFNYKMKYSGFIFYFYFFQCF